MNRIEAVPRIWHGKNRHFLSFGELRELLVKLLGATKNRRPTEPALRKQHRAKELEARSAHAAEHVDGNIRQGDLRAACCSLPDDAAKEADVGPD